MPQEILERDIEKYLKKKVEQHGGEYRRLKWYGRRGAPDDFVALNGAHLTECKRPGAKPDPHQDREHNRLRKRGVAVTVLDSYEAVDLFVKDILYNGS